MSSTYNNSTTCPQICAPKAKSKIVKTYHHSISMTYDTLLSRGDLRLDSDPVDTHRLMSTMMLNGSGEDISSSMNKYSIGTQSIVDSGMASHDSLLDRNDQGLSQFSLLTTASSARGEFDSLNRPCLLDSHLQDRRRSASQTRGISPCRPAGHGVRQMINFFEGSPTRSSSGNTTPKHRNYLSSREQSQDRSRSSLSPLRNGSSSSHSKNNNESRSGSPSNRKDSVLHLSCVASGYSKYSPYSQRKAYHNQTNGVETNSEDSNHQSVCSVGVGKSNEKRTENLRDTALDTGVIELNLSDTALDTGDIELNIETVTNGIETITPGDLDNVDRVRIPEQSKDTEIGNTLHADLAQNKNSCDIADTVHDSPSKKGGEWFLKITDVAQEKLLCSCEKAQADLDTTLTVMSEEISGQIRAAIGKAHLLVNKKFKQFRGLCDRNITQRADEPLLTTSQDLAGFWDMVDIQVEDVMQNFRDIDTLRANGWEQQKLPVHTSKSTCSANKLESKHKVNRATPSKSSSSKARDEARKRLMAAKRAMRVRRNSQEVSDDVIIVSSPGH